MLLARASELKGFFKEWNRKLKGRVLDLNPDKQKLAPLCSRLTMR